MNYCEITCKCNDDFNTAHVMIDENWNDSLNYQMIQSVNVLKDLSDVKEYDILNIDDIMYIINDICKSCLFNLTYIGFIVQFFKAIYL